MSVALAAGTLTDALTVRLELHPLPPEQVVDGSPSAGFVVLDASDEREIGVWEMTPGTATDVEDSEIFVVLAGRATLEGVAADPIRLTVGSVVSLTAGMQTTWIVTETLRKLFIA